jgi:hypothetical protein
LEYANAVANNNVVEDIGKISVIVDGGSSHWASLYCKIWSSHNYWGTYKKKKFMGVRNKFCSICVMELRKATTNPARLL